MLVSVPQLNPTCNPSCVIEYVAAKAEISQLSVQADLVNTMVGHGTHVVSLLNHIEKARTPGDPSARHPPTKSAVLEARVCPWLRGSSLALARGRTDKLRKPVIAPGR